MKRIALVILSMALLTSPAYAKKKADVPIKAGIQEAQAATLDDEQGTEKPKKKKAVKKAKKHKKAKKQ